MSRFPLLLVLLFALLAACPDGDDDDATGDPCAGDDVGEDLDDDTYRSCGNIAELVDCDDNDATVHPDADETCGDGVDNDCNGTADDLDQDDDGFISDECFGPDCNDLNAEVFPDRPESCDGEDNDCDGNVDDGFDADDDGWTSCAGDCVNSDAFINPDAEELCDGLDNDCDCLDVPQDTNGDGTLCGPGDKDVDEAFDTDEDGFIDGSDPLCIDIYGPNADFAAFGDCNDDDAAVFPEAHEDASDGLDNDCDSCVDECFDHDGDGIDNCADTDSGDPTCIDPAQQGSGDIQGEPDCLDSPAHFLATVVYPGFTIQDTLMDGTPVTMTEICGDKLDNNCDGVIDEGYDDGCNPIE
jgi:large repetitive protein